MKKIPPGSVIGIIGGGQLGRMTAQAAKKLGYKTHIYSPDDDGPAKKVTDYATTASYNDEETLAEFASLVDVITFEFENIPYSTVKVLEDLAIVRPNANCLHVAQNRVREKDFINSVGVPTASYYGINSKEDITAAFAAVGTERAILKTAEFGYDGKGQVVVRSQEELYEAWQGISSVLEGFVGFTKEVSVIIARSEDGESVCFPVGENVHKNGILDTTEVPASIGEETEGRAKEFTKKIADELDLIGLLAVEFFVLGDGNLLANEIAPRPHNSGHWTMDGCATSQFEQLIRTICGLPFGDVRLLGRTRMKNLIGEDVLERQTNYIEQGARVHTYEKSEIRPGRKMGHVNFVDTQ